MTVFKSEITKSFINKAITKRQNVIKGMNILAVTKMVEIGSWRNGMPLARTPLRNADLSVETRALRILGCRLGLTVGVVTNLCMM